jgi:hypothetical protein
MRYLMRGLRLIVQRALRSASGALLLGSLVVACAGHQDGMERYAERVATTGDSAIEVLAAFASSDTAAAIVWDSAAAGRLERLATSFAGVLRPDTAVALHRQMLEGLDTLVVVMRTVRAHELQCGEAPDISCRGAVDHARFRASLRRGQSLYLAARAHLDSVLAVFDAQLPAPPRGLVADR